MEDSLSVPLEHPERTVERAMRSRAQRAFAKFIPEGRVMLKNPSVASR
jgi:hypothetical protein